MQNLKVEKTAPKPGTQYAWGHIAWDNTPVMRICPECDKLNDITQSLKGECISCGYRLTQKDFEPAMPEDADRARGPKGLSF